jgi:alpha-tubulin suppressor-like RCC1 family protein
LALSADGLVWSWGSNDCGQLGLSGHAPAKEKGKKPMDIKRRIAHLESEVE